MKVVCDTHIWYYLGSGKIDSGKINPEVSLVATYVSIKEVAKTPNLLENISLVRDAIRVMMKKSHHIIYCNPLIYIAKLKHPDYPFDAISEMGQLLEFTSAVANGAEVKEGKIAEAEKYLMSFRNDLSIVSEMWNAEAMKIKERIKDKKAHRKEDAMPINRELIARMVQEITKGAVDIRVDFDWNKLELFMAVLNAWFGELELSQMKITENDWMDLFILVYVQPGGFVWTMEKRWINLIENNAGMAKYLYKI